MRDMFTMLAIVVCLFACLFVLFVCLVGFVFGCCFANVFKHMRVFVLASVCLCVCCFSPFDLLLPVDTWCG